ncbi:putative oxidoreductase [Hordeum vulgare]|nr:putative oxidoreductase [Hordeum vulgare]
MTALYHEVEKKPFAFSHCWLLLNGKSKWTQVVADLKTRKKRNDGSNSHQFIGLDGDDNKVVVTNGRATVQKDNRQVMGNKWEKARISHDAAATKISSTWTGIFLTRKNKKEERYKLMLDAQKERMDWDQMRVGRRLEIEKEKIELEKQDATIKWELKKANTFGEIELEKERLQLAWDTKDVKIMLADETHLNAQAKKWDAEKKKEINYRRVQEAAGAAAAEHATKMKAEHVARMHMKAEHIARMQVELATQSEQDKLDEKGEWMSASDE